MKITITTILLSLTLQAVALPQGFDMARFQALGSLETGNDDRRVGSHGEVTRYQMLPEVWRRGFGAWSRPDQLNPVTATQVAQAEMARRVAAFASRTGRPPTDREWSLMWHCPARVSRPTASDSDYAQRFVNLLANERR